MTVFDVAKQLELDVFCEVIFGLANNGSTEEEFKEALQTDYSKEALQQLNEAALRQGHHPISFSG